MRSDLVARAYAILRGVMVLVFCAFLLLLPDKMMPGSSAEPARSLALVFASRTILLGVIMVILAVRKQREALGWVLIADAALQVFDTALSLAQHQGAIALMPFLLGVVDLWAARILIKARTQTQEKRA